MAHRTPGHRFVGPAKHPNVETEGIVTDIVHCPGHSAPLMEVRSPSGEESLTFAPESITVGEKISFCQGAEIKPGNVLPLKEIPEGTLIHNIELRPGDGGKLVRASGTFAKVLTHGELGTTVKLPSNKEKLLLSECRAAIGTISGAGRQEKPFMKAGVRWKRMRARNQLYPVVCGISMSAVDHPFGGKCSHIKGRPTLSPRSAPPGRKVGKIAPSRTGRRQR